METFISKIPATAARMYIKTAPVTAGATVMGQNIITIQDMVGKMVVAGPPDHRLADRKHIGPVDFVDERQVAIPATVTERTKLDEVFLAHRIQRRINIETQISYAAIKLVEAGAGVAIIDPLTACGYREGRVRFIPFFPDVASEYSIVVSARHASTLVLKPFIDLAREEIRRLLPKAWTLKENPQKKRPPATAP